MKAVLSFVSLVLIVMSFSSQTSALQISFMNEEGCSQSDNAAFCRAYQGVIGNWKDSEKSIVQASFPTSALGRFKVLEDLLRQVGVEHITLVRLKQGSKKEDLVAEPYYSHKKAYMAIGSEYFRFKMDYPSGVIFQTHTLIHELAHLQILTTVGYNMNSPFWTSLAESTSWSVVGGFYHPEFSKGYRQAADASRTAVKAGDFAKGAAIEFAFTRSAGFPSIYSMGKILEFQAELIAFLTHDSKLEKELSQDLKTWLVLNGYSELLENYQPINETPYRAGSLSTASHFDFVGLLYSEGRVVCTISIVKHGLLVTAKHCLAPFAQEIKRESKPSFLTVKFPYARTKVVLTGLGFINSELDAGDNDLAYFEYDPHATREIIDVPQIEWSTSPLDYKIGDSLIVPSYRFPKKIRRQKLGVQECKVGAKVARLDHALPIYKGDFQDSTCTGYNLASGSPFLKKTANGYKLIGVLSHTFEINNSTGEILPQSLKEDEWGLYTSTVFSPAFLAKSKLVAATTTLSKTQRALIQAAEQKLRKVVNLELSSAPAQQLSTARFQLGVKLRIAQNMRANKEQITMTIADMLAGREQNELLEDELVVSMEPLGAVAFRVAMENLKAQLNSR